MQRRFRKVVLEMTCYHPLVAYKITYFVDGVNHSRIQFMGSYESDPVRYDDIISRGEFDNSNGQHFEPLKLPCGRCIGCRLDRSLHWAVRCVHEASLHDQNCFLTLTYDDQHLRSDSLIKKDLQDFWKRLRKVISPRKIRYFACGEYGEQFQRPHYHACVFGYWPDDAFLYTVRSGSELYLSPMIGRLWPFGFHTIGKVNFESAAYVARYVLKKVNGEPAGEHYHGRVPEFVVMSRKPGIAADWIKTYYGDVYPADYVVVRDKFKLKPPRYYDQIYDEECNGDLEYIKNKRKDDRFHKVLSCDDLNRKERYKKVIIKNSLIRHFEAGK